MEMLNRLHEEYLEYIRFPINVRRKAFWWDAWGRTFLLLSFLNLSGLFPRWVECFFDWETPISSVSWMGSFILIYSMGFLAAVFRNRLLEEYEETLNETKDLPLAWKVEKYAILGRRYPSEMRRPRNTLRHHNPECTMAKREYDLE